MEKEKRQFERKEREEENAGKKKEREVREKPLCHLLLQLSDLSKASDSITVTIMNAFALRHRGIPWPSPYPKGKKREELVDALLGLVSKNEEGEIEFEWISKQ